MRPGRAVLLAGGTTLGLGVAWGLFESQWVEFDSLDVPVRGLPAELDGFRILHLSDFHLGARSLNAVALGRALDRAEERELDLVAVTGDLLSRRRGEPVLRAALGRLRAAYGVFAVLGNHDVAETRDPFSQTADLSRIDETGAVLLEGSSTSFGVGGARVQVAGVDPAEFVARRARPEDLVDGEAAFRILLCHFPDVVRRLPPHAYQLVLVGHLHGGQICLPAPGGRVRLEHLGSHHWEGLVETEAGMLHVSRGLGTSFVPFRLLARPQATELTLRREE